MRVMQRKINTPLIIQYYIVQNLINYVIVTVTVTSGQYKIMQTHQHS